MPSPDQIKKVIDELLEQPRTPEEQVNVLRNCLEVHALAHPWADGDLVDSILGNIAREFSLDYEEEDDG